MSNLNNFTMDKLKADAREVIQAAKFGTKPEHYKDAAGDGVHYERKVLNRIEKMKTFEGFELIRNQWIQWKSTNGKWHGCEPDGILINDRDKIVVIIECKMAFWAAGISDIVRLYKPIMEFFYPDYEILGLVVSQRSYINGQDNPLKDVTLEQIRETKHGLLVTKTRERGSRRTEKSRKSRRPKRPSRPKNRTGQKKKGSDSQD